MQSLSTLEQTNSIELILFFIPSLIYLILEPVRGLEKIWLIGDVFGEKTYQDYYKQSGLSAENKMYGFTNFEIRDFFSSKNTSLNRIVAGRIINNLINALNEHNTLPKLIVVIQDDDIIYDMQDKPSLFFIVKGLITWMMRETTKAIEIYKDYLPAKAKKVGWPHILWIAPPQLKFFHNNKDHKMLADCLHKEVCFHQNMTVLNMLKF